MSEIADRLEKIEQNICAACERAGRTRESVKLVVVTKTVGTEEIREVIQQGYTDLGESRVQHLKDVAEGVDEYLTINRGRSGVPAGVKWHMIGHLQRNKVKKALKYCSSIQSVDTLRLAEEINTNAGKQGLRPDVFIQVNCSGESQKYGVPVGAAGHLAEQIETMGNLRLVGLMTMAPLTKDDGVIRSCFARAREVFEDIRRDGLAGSQFRHLSMGMSQDYQIAVEEGATVLRVGSAIFAG
ncbi:pyridoxal phosphate enzyme, YggS family [Anaerohalosphaera lusitana]|uniref:Pyridoxal phosphate homeostasis protein n=1 Tax=Anaerohalosphaera lusitana TaxID=1936003 RepID=A0A1U9NJ38_9BACT|nr:YggS family pyridoxal phosphate-dependent enzyme [Anaerohalosphaera lusitana]AQT67526.1 pyridoxal phosphate enzyme, YggS family [Anaerohalosphaera lusitana]